MADSRFRDHRARVDDWEAVNQKKQLSSLRDAALVDATDAERSLHRRKIKRLISGYETALENIHRKELKDVGISAEFADLLKLSERVAQNSKALYQALTAGAALVAIPENVENLNYLQCAWSHSAVYSNRQDFSFARRVPRKSAVSKHRKGATLDVVGLMNVFHTYPKD
jgi:hypothetical protein